MQSSLQNRFSTPQSRNSKKKTLKTQPSPHKPVHLDIDQSSIPNNPQWSNHARCHIVSSQLTFSPQLSNCCTKIGGANAQVASTSEQRRFLWQWFSMHHRAAHLDTCFHWWITDVKYTWCKICKKQTGYWVSCTGIPEYRGSKMEAQMTLGHFYLVHRRIILQRPSLKRKQ